MKDKLVCGQSSWIEKVLSSQDPEADEEVEKTGSLICNCYNPNIMSKAGVQSNRENKYSRGPEIASTEIASIRKIASTDSETEGFPM
jgi:hypothetical protein